MKLSPGLMKTVKARSGQPTVKGTGLTRSQLDRHSMYCGSRVSVSKMLGQIEGRPAPAKLEKHGYLLVSGNKPGVLIREVQHDGDFYRLPDGKFGSVSAMNKVGGKTLTAALVDRSELLSRARKHNRPMEVTHAKTKERLTVWPINDFGDQYVAALTVNNGKLEIRNIEHPESFNKKDVQYTDPKPVKMDFSKFFAKVH